MGLVLAAGGESVSSPVLVCLGCDCKPLPGLDSEYGVLGSGPGSIRAEGPCWYAQGNL